MKIQFDDEREDITIKEEEKDVKKLKVKKPKKGKKASKKQ
jgi:hypothetical protein|tara:strand:+ start:2394 stop:2513 length:120 start_codon:yes stop_codon:yes gene_type:complete